MRRSIHGLVVAVTMFALQGCGDVPAPASTRQAPMAMDGASVDGVDASDGAAGAMRIFWRGPLISNPGPESVIVDSFELVAATAGLTAESAVAIPLMFSPPSVSLPATPAQLERAERNPLAGAVIDPTVNDRGGTWISLIITIPGDGFHHLGGVRLRYHTSAATYDSTFRAGLEICSGAVFDANRRCPLPDQAADNSHRFEGAGIALALPVSWQVHDGLPAMSGFGQVWAIVGTVPWGPCGASDLNCHYEQRLEPGQIEVEIGVETFTSETLCELGATRPDLAARSSSDPAAAGSLLRIDGRPAVRTDYAVNGADYYRSDEWVTILLAPIGTTRVAYRLHAKYRGPDTASLRSQFEHVLSTVQLSADPWFADGGPDDCGAPFPPD